MIQIQLNPPMGFDVQDAPDNPDGSAGGKIMIFQDPSNGIVVVVPLDEPSARDLSGRLRGTKLVMAPASALPVLNGQSR